MVEHRIPNQEVLGSTSIGATCCILEQDTLSPQSNCSYTGSGGSIPSGQNVTSSNRVEYNFVRNTHMGTRKLVGLHKLMSKHNTRVGVGQTTVILNLDLAQ